MQNQNYRQSSASEIARRIEALTQQRDALLLDIEALRKKIADQKKAFAQLSQQTEAFYQSMWQSKQRELSILEGNEPALSAWDERQKRQLNPDRSPSPLEQQVQHLKGGWLKRLIDLVLCRYFPGHGLLKANRIDKLRQQAHNAWRYEVQVLEREVKEAERALQFPRYTDEQRALQTATLSDERDLARIAQVATSKEIEIATLQSVLPQSQADDQARAQEQSERNRVAAETQSDRATAAATYKQVAQSKLDEEEERRRQQTAKRAQDAQLRQEEEAARRIILQAQVDEALARKKAAEVLRDAALAQTARAASQPQMAPSGASVPPTGPDQVIITEVRVLESSDTLTHRP